MKFIAIQIANENDRLETDISSSDEGLRPSKPSYHLMLGPALNGDIVLTPAEMLSVSASPSPISLRTSKK
jgi:hypothetical protein